MTPADEVNWQVPHTWYCDDAGHERRIPAQRLPGGGWSFTDAGEPGHRPCDESCPRGDD